MWRWRWFGVWGLWGMWCGCCWGRGWWMMRMCRYMLWGWWRGGWGVGFGISNSRMGGRGVEWRGWRWVGCLDGGVGVIVVGVVVVGWGGGLLVCIIGRGWIWGGWWMRCLGMGRRRRWWLWCVGWRRWWGSWGSMWVFGWGGGGWFGFIRRVLGFEGVLMVG